MIEVSEDCRDEQPTIVKANQEHAQEVQGGVHTSNVPEETHDVVDLTIVDVVLPDIAKVSTDDVPVFFVITIIIVIDILNLYKIDVCLLTELHIVVLEGCLREHQIDVCHLLACGLKIEEIPVINKLLDDTYALNLVKVIHLSRGEVAKVDIGVDHGNAQSCVCKELID